MHVRSSDELLAAAASVLVRRITLDSRTYGLPRQLIVAGSGAVGPPRNLTIACVDPMGTTVLRSLQGPSRSTEARVLKVEGGAHVHLEGLTLTGGWWSADRFGGGGMLVHGADAHVTMRRCAVEGNGAKQSGGGIDVYLGTLTLEDCVVANNSGVGGGGLNLYFSPGVLLANSSVEANVATSVDGGGIFNWGTKLTLLRTRVAGNRAGGGDVGPFQGLGGGVCNLGGEVRMDGCLLVGNEARSQGGALHNLFLVNDTGAVGGASAVLVDTQIVNNSAPDGAAIYNYGGYAPSATANGSLLTPIGARLVLFGERSVVSGNVAGTSSGTALANSGTALVGRGAKVVGNLGAAQASNQVGANLSYVLPLPPGTWYSRISTCEARHCFVLHPMAQYSPKQSPCPHQACDIPRLEEALQAAGVTGEEAAGQRVVELPAGVVEGDSIPLVCPGRQYYCPGMANWSGYVETAVMARRVRDGYMSVGPSRARDSCTNDCVAEAPCPPGYWCSAGLSLACPTGTYASEGASLRTTAEACVPCPGWELGYSTAATACTSVDHCEAMPGYLKRNGTFEPCFEGTVCLQRGTTLETLRLKAGFWRPGFLATNAKRCPYGDAACAGGVSGHPAYERYDGSMCADGMGLAGPYCQLCQNRSSFYLVVEDRAAGMRVECRECTRWYTALSILLLLGLLLLAGAFLYLWRTHQCLSWAVRMAARLSLRPKLKIIVGFYQIASQLGRVYGVALPPLYARIMSAFRFVTNLAFFTDLPGMHPTCLGVPDLSSQLLIATVECNVPAWSFGWSVSAGPQLYPPNDIVASAWLAILVHGVGVPLCYAALLCTRKPALQRALGFLTDGYVPSARWWELVEVGKKLLLTGWLALVPSSLGQLYVAVVASLLLLIVLLMVRPYARPDNNFLAVIADLALVFSLLGTVALEVSSLEGPAGTGGTLVVLAAAAILVACVGVALVVVEVRAARTAPYARWASDESFIVPRELAPIPGRIVRFHAFISHQWSSGQDQARTIKGQLQLLLPGFRAFLDVDDLTETSALEAHVEASDSVIVFLAGSLSGAGQASDYFCSTAATREFRHAVAVGKPCVLVLETDPSHGGVAFDTHREACPADLRSAFDHMPLVRWHRVREFQLVALRLILRAVLHERQTDAVVFRQPLPPLRRQCRLYVSPHQPRAAAVAALVADASGGEVMVTTEQPERADRFLVLLDGSTDGTGMRGNAALHDELESALSADGQVWVRCAEAAEWAAFDIEHLRVDHFVTAANGDRYEPRARPGAPPPLLLVHEQRGAFAPVPFSYFLGLQEEGGPPVTPPGLLKLGVYEQIAVPLYDAEYSEASVRLLLLKLADAQPDHRVIAKLLQPLRSVRQTVSPQAWRARVGQLSVQVSKRSHKHPGGGEGRSTTELEMVPPSNRLLEGAP